MVQRCVIGQWLGSAGMLQDCMDIPHASVPDILVIGWGEGYVNNPVWGKMFLSLGPHLLRKSVDSHLLW